MRTFVSLFELGLGGEVRHGGLGFGGGCVRVCSTEGRKLGGSRYEEKTRDIRWARGVIYQGKSESSEEEMQRER